MRSAITATCLLLVFGTAACEADSDEPENAPSGAAASPSVADYSRVLEELEVLAPDAGWTLPLATTFADNTCADMQEFTYEAVVKDRTRVLDGDRAHAQGGVIAAVTYVCPELKGKIPGL